ncbi:MAG TPA: response regulator [Bryobacteraceae bacterium]|nr:response regulator [Bryobacteraceae bacterium]
MAADSRETILVVEDAEPIRKMVCSMLRGSGYGVKEAADGAEALVLLERECGSVHLVLTDVIMPEMSGAELARHLSRVCPKLPIIFMSGYTEDTVVRGVESVGSIFLPKPFTAAVLVEKVRQALDRL